MINKAFFRGGVFAAALMTITIFQASGAVATERALTFAVRGVVSEMLVKEGQAVKKGAPLARLDLRPLQARKRGAMAKLKASSLRMDRARDNQARTRQLYDDLAASGEALEKAETTLVEAEADHEVAKAKVDIINWRLERATLTAPTDGRITAIPGFPGMVVFPHGGQIPVIIIDLP